MKNDKNHTYSSLEQLFLLIKEMDHKIEEWVHNIIEQIENQGQKE